MEKEEITEEPEKLKEGETKGIDSSPIMEEARAVNKEKAELLDREEKLQTRKEKFHAEQIVSGKGIMQEGNKQEETDKEYRMRINKEMAAGRTEFGN